MPSAGNKFVPNKAAIAALLKTDWMRELVDSKGEEVLGIVESEDPMFKMKGGQESDRVPVLGSSYTTDRAAFAVTLAHPAGIPLEAKYGYLMRAAVAAGFEQGRVLKWVTKSGTVRKASAKQIAHWGRGKAS